MKVEISKQILALSILILGLSSSAYADSIIKFSLGPTGPDFQYEGGLFSTPDDGNASTSGDQDSSIRFVGPLSFLSDILSGGSFSLDGVATTGVASVNGALLSQSTAGGTFNVYDASNSLLLSGSLDTGVISGATSSSTGSFFNSTAATFTGGSLLAYVAPTPAGISIALSNILSAGLSGMSVPVGCGGACQLNDFTASADGIIDGTATSVPEPATLGLLMSGLAGGLLRRRKLANNV